MLQQCHAANNMRNFYLHFPQERREETGGFVEFLIDSSQICYNNQEEFLIKIKMISLEDPSYLKLIGVSKIKLGQIQNDGIERIFCHDIHTMRNNKLLTEPIGQIYGQTQYLELEAQIVNYVDGQPQLTVSTMNTPGTFDEKRERTFTNSNSPIDYPNSVQQPQNQPPASSYILQGLDSKLGRNISVIIEESRIHESSDICSSDQEQEQGKFTNMLENAKPSHQEQELLERERESEFQSYQRSFQPQLFDESQITPIKSEENNQFATSEMSEYANNYLENQQIGKTPLNIEGSLEFDAQEQSVEVVEVQSSFDQRSINIVKPCEVIIQPNQTPFQFQPQSSDQFEEQRFLKSQKQQVYKSYNDLPTDQALELSPGPSQFKVMEFIQSTEGSKVEAGQISLNTKGYNIVQIDSRSSDEEGQVMFASQIAPPQTTQPNMIMQRQENQEQIPPSPKLETGLDSPSYDNMTLSEFKVNQIEEVVEEEMSPNCQNDSQQETVITLNEEKSQNPQIGPDRAQDSSIRINTSGSVSAVVVPNADQPSSHPTVQSSELEIQVVEIVSERRTFVENTGNGQSISKGTSFISAVPTPTSQQPIMQQTPIHPLYIRDKDFTEEEESRLDSQVDNLQVEGHHDQGNLNTFRPTQQKQQVDSQAHYQEHLEHASTMEPRDEGKVQQERVNEERRMDSIQKCDKIIHRPHTDTRIVSSTHPTPRFPIAANHQQGNPRLMTNESNLSVDRTSDSFSNSSMASKLHQYFERKANKMNADLVPVASLKTLEGPERIPPNKVFKVSATNTIANSQRKLQMSQQKQIISSSKLATTQGGAKQNPQARSSLSIRGLTSGGGQPGKLSGRNSVRQSTKTVKDEAQKFVRGLDQQKEQKRAVKQNEPKNKFKQNHYVSIQKKVLTSKSKQGNETSQDKHEIFRAYHSHSSLQNRPQSHQSSSPAQPSPTPSKHHHSNHARKPTPFDTSDLAGQKLDDLNDAIEKEISSEVKKLKQIKESIDEVTRRQKQEEQKEQASNQSKYTHQSPYLKKLRQKHLAQTNGSAGSTSKGGIAIFNHPHASRNNLVKNQTQVESSDQIPNLNDKETADNLIKVEDWGELEEQNNKTLSEQLGSPVSSSQTCDRRWRKERILAKISNSSGSLNYPVASRQDIVVQKDDSKKKQNESTKMLPAPIVIDYSKHKYTPDNDKPNLTLDSPINVLANSHSVSPLPTSPKVKSPNPDAQTDSPKPSDEQPQADSPSNYAKIQIIDMSSQDDKNTIEKHGVYKSKNDNPFIQMRKVPEPSPQHKQSFESNIMFNRESVNLDRRNTTEAALMKSPQMMGPVHQYMRNLQGKEGREEKEFRGSNRTSAPWGYSKKMVSLQYRKTVGNKQSPNNLTSTHATSMQRMSPVPKNNGRPSPSGKSGTNGRSSTRNHGQTNSTTNIIITPQRQNRKQRKEFKDLRIKLKFNEQSQKMEHYI